MAEQPAPRAYEPADFFPHRQSVRPIEPGTVHRAQYLSDDPMVTWLTDKGRRPEAGPEWKQTVDPNGPTAPPPGAPTSEANYVTEFPFPITAKDLKRGQERFNVFCAVCHGAAGDGNGKIPERGFMKPPSYHVDPAGQAKDTWNAVPAFQNNKTKPDAGDPTKTLPRGHSRGFERYGQVVPLDRVPVGYIFQVITWGYGGMPDLAYQIPPEDRWRIAAYVRALQLSQGAAPADAAAARQPEPKQP